MTNLESRPKRTGPESAVGLQKHKRTATDIGIALLTPLVGALGLATTVTLAFAVAASTFCPLLVLGVWWRGLSVVGARAGMISGGLLSLGAAAVTVSRAAPAGWPQTLAANPAAWSVPIAFAVTILVSLATPSRVPGSALATMARLHTPEGLLSHRS